MLKPLADRVVLKMTKVDGKEIKMYVKTGDKVVITKYAGTEIKYEGEDYIIVKQNDILAIAE